MSKKKIEKVYKFDFFVDLYTEDDCLLCKKYANGYYECHATSWKEALFKFLVSYRLSFIANDKEKFLKRCYVGFPHHSLTCNDKLCDFNYINRIIVDDPVLSRYFYC